MIVDVVQVVQNHEKSLSRIAKAQGAEGFADVRDRLATPKQATEAVRVHIIETKKLFGSFQTVIRRSDTPRSFLASPSNTPDGLQIQRNGKVTTDAFRSIAQAESSLDLVDDPVPLVDADRKSQVPELGSQCALLSSRERPEFQMSCHPVLLEEQNSTY